MLEKRENKCMGKKDTSIEFSTFREETRFTLCHYAFSSKCERNNKYMASEIFHSLVINKFIY